MSVATMFIGAVLLSCCLIEVGGTGLLKAAALGRRSRDAWPAAWKQVADHNTSDSPSTRETESSGGNWSHYDNETDKHGETEEEKEIERYKVAAFDFEYVRIHLMIGIWVLFASIAKIGK